MPLKGFEEAATGLSREEFRPRDLSFRHQTRQSTRKGALWQTSCKSLWHECHCEYRASLQHQGRAFFSIPGAYRTASPLEVVVGGFAGGKMDRGQTEAGLSAAPVRTGSGEDGVRRNHRMALRSGRRRDGGRLRGHARSLPDLTERTGRHRRSIESSRLEDAVRLLPALERDVGKAGRKEP